MPTSGRKLISHGPASSLIQHTLEVALAARSRWERIAVACHDAPKATEAWQDYAYGGFTADSPHLHAEIGAVLACLLLAELGAPEAEVRKALALAGHHSGLGELHCFADGLGDIRKVLADAQARQFFCETLPDVFNYRREAAEKAWGRAEALTADNVCSVFAPRSAAKRTAPYADAEDVTTWLDARDLLGRMVKLDRLSAAHQSLRAGEMFAPPATPDRAFRTRQPRTFPAPSSAGAAELAALRSELAERTVDLAREAGVGDWLAVCSPTGTGKTNALLLAAEVLAQRRGCKRIIYALPLTTIADQIYDDYLSPSAGTDAIIWNYRRKEKRQPTERGDVWETIEVTSDRFDASYTVTTFNQALLAAGHPGRMNCVAGAEMADAVIILDEVHKLPRFVQVHGLALLDAFARRNNCHIIMASATLPPECMLRLPAPVRSLPAEFVRRMCEAEAVAGRRTYEPHRRRNMTVEELADEVRGFHCENPSRNLLVMLNLAFRGTAALGKLLGGSLRADLRHSFDMEDRRVFVLDNLVPRAHQVLVLREVNDRLRAGLPTTLIATSLIEAGVDLDFDELWEDFLSLSSTLQRGGRCGRNYGPGRNCVVRSFLLVVADAKGNQMTSREHMRPDPKADAALPGGLFGEDAHAFDIETAWFNQGFKGRMAENELATKLTEVMVRSSWRLDEATRNGIFRMTNADFAGFTNALQVAAATDPISEKDQESHAIILPSAEVRDDFLEALATASKIPTRVNVRRLQWLRARYAIRSSNPKAIISVTEGLTRIERDDDGCPIFTADNIY